MSGKHKTVYLLLALACFLGIILVFVFDGYMGVYDTLLVDNGQFRQTINAGQWQEQEEFGFYPSVSVDRGLGAEFTYTIDNHRFSAYTADIEVTAWYGAEKIADVASGRITAPAFGSGELSWTMEAAGLLPPGYPENQSYNVTVFIKRGDVERRVMYYINPGPPVPGIKILPPARS